MKVEIRLKDNLKFTKVPPDKVLRQFLWLSSEELTSLVKKETPVDYGKLRGSWTPKLESKRLKLINSRNYAVFVEKGTGIFGPRGHRIFPKSASVLHWQGKGTSHTVSNGSTSYTISNNGQGIFARNVRGRPAAHMAEKGLEKFRFKIPKLFNTAVKQTIAK